MKQSLKANQSKTKLKKPSVVYAKIFDESTISDGRLIMRAKPTALPETLRATASNKAHLGGHSGEDTMKQTAKPFLVF